MQHVRDAIKANFAELSAAFVFPSEVIAAFWCEESLRIAGVQAVRADRFISWDTFKERVFRSEEVKRPANRLYRSIFVSAYLEENRRRPTLRIIVNSAYADNSAAFERSIRSMLPGLEPLMRSSATLEKTVGPDLYRDLQALHSSYREFLALHDLFEPGWIEPGTPRIDRNYLLFFPEVLEDYPEYAAILSSEKSVQVVATSAREPESTLREYSNSTQEIADLMDALEQLLDAGVAPSDIALTLPAIDVYRPAVERQAILRQIPLSFRAGAPLTAYAPGRFLAGLAEVADSGYSLESLTAYFLNLSVPWKALEQNRNLVRFGMNWNVAPSFTERGRPQDNWETAFRRARRGIRESDEQSAILGKSVADLSAHYRSIRSSIEGIRSATSFRGLREMLYAFFRLHLDTGSWSDELLPAFQSCMEVLSDLVAAEADFDLNLTLNPYRVWVSALNEKIYVPRDGNAGIGVYPYRVAAGLQPRYHFVAGTSHEATRVMIARYPYLREDQKSELGVADRDLSASFSALQARSGVNVFASYSREVPGAAQIAAGYYVRQRQVLQVERGSLTEAACSAAGCESGRPAAVSRLRIEQAYWLARSGALFPDSLYAVQKRGFDFQSSTGLGPRGNDFTRHPVADPAVQEILLQAQLAPEAPAFLRLSAAHLERFVDCPFAYLFAYGLRVDDEPFGPDYLGSTSIGNIYHRVLERLYRTIQIEHGSLSADALSDYLALLDGVIDRELDEGGNSTQLSPDGRVPVPVSIPLHPALVEVVRRKAGKLLARFLESDWAMAAGHQLVTAEDWYSAKLEEGKVYLFGRIDRITQDTASGRYALVDYKKNRVPRKSAIRHLLEETLAAGQRQHLESSDGRSDGDESGDTVAAVERGALQIPVYAALARAKGRPLERAAFYSIETGSFAPFYEPGNPKAMVDEEELSHLVEHVHRLAAAVAGRVRSGDYRIDADDAGCDSCSIRQICRARYTVRNP